MIEFYKEFGELGYLANYSNHGFTKNGIFYKTVEHYYQSEKFDDPEIKNKIINADTPKEASNIGRDRNLKRIDDFKSIKNQVMFDGILEKFRQNRDIAYKLIETRNKKIAEATIDEYYWGIGKDKSGKNVIGDILVRVRERIKEEILDSIISKCKNKEIYVLGHKNPDADSIISSYILSNVLKGLGANAQFAVLSEDYNYCKSDIKLITDYVKVKPVIVDDVNNKLFVLVDHNNLEGLSSENVLGAIDHHIITGEVYDTLEIEYASTCLLIYDLFKDKYEFTDDEKELIALSVLADTDYLCSSRFTEEDKKLFNELNFKLDVSELQKKYFLVNDMNLSIEDNLKVNYKEYDKSTKIKRSLIYTYTDDYKNNMSKYVEYLKDKNEWLLIWCEFESKNTYVYFKGEIYEVGKLITSTNLIFKYLEEQGITI
ncbi:MAG: DUF1768 domain-containing protein [Firmicutes bacterium]|nr:DUF1768 domain-containing protein [Bacillota bacterium]